MTHTNLTRWIKAADSRRARPRSSTMRACLHSAVATMRSGIKAFVSDRHQSEVQCPIDQGAGLSNRGHDQKAPGYIGSFRPAVNLAEMIIAALAVIAGILVLDLLVLWIAAGKLIERIPF